MSDLLSHLSRELGRPAAEECNLRHPELRNAPDAMVARLIDSVEYIMQVQGWPRTVECAERAYKVLEASGDLEAITQQYAPAPAPGPFKPRADEEEWLRAAPIDEVRNYLQAKYQEKP